MEFRKLAVCPALAFSRFASTAPATGDVPRPRAVRLFPCDCAMVSNVRLICCCPPAWYPLMSCEAPSRCCTICRRRACKGLYAGSIVGAVVVDDLFLLASAPPTREAPPPIMDARTGAAASGMVCPFLATGRNRPAAQIPSTEAP